MEFKLFIDSAPQEILLKFLNTVCNSNRDGEKGQKISRQLEIVLLIRVSLSLLDK